MELSTTASLQSVERDRVRSSTRPEINERIDKELERNVRFYACQDKETISERIRELDREWDIERTLMANAASLSLVGLTMGILSGRKWLILPLVVGSFLLNHAIKGWCPPLPLLRKYKVRTRAEIEREKYALKIIRGDLDNLEKQQEGGFKPDIRRLLQDLKRNGFAG